MEACFYFTFNLTETLKNKEKIINLNINNLITLQTSGSFISPQTWTIQRINLKIHKRSLLLLFPKHISKISKLTTQDVFPQEVNNFAMSRSETYTVHLSNLKLF